VTGLLAEIRKQKFLVIDPTAHTRSATAQMLRATGAGEVECVANFAEAVGRGFAFRPTIILTEWNLGTINQDGIILTKMVRHSKTPFARDVGIVIVTDRCTRADVETARITGVDEYLMRPYSTGALVDRLKGVVLNRRPFVDCPVYIGPCRRRKMTVDFPGDKRRMCEEVDAASAEVSKNLARSKIASATEAARVIDAQRANEVHKIAGDLMALAEGMNDTALTTIAKSLRMYIESVGASAGFDADVVSAHVDAMNQIINLPNVETTLRDDVTRALQALVAKRLRAAA
jgi:DNA-binding response OmpR family regulator